MSDLSSCPHNNDYRHSKIVGKRFFALGLPLRGQMDVYLLHTSMKNTITNPSAGA